MGHVSGSKVLASVVVLVAMVTGGAGCASAQDGGARQAAQRFYEAVTGKDSAAACGSLSVRTRAQLEKTEKASCRKVILRQDIPRVGTPTKVEVFGSMAKVTYPGEAAFLSRFAGGWRVVAAGCRPAVGQPYDCEIEGS